MVIRKNKQKKTKRIKIRSGATKTRKRQKANHLGSNLLKMLKASLVACVFLSAGALLYSAERYVKSLEPVATGPVELFDTPDWVGDQLKAKILATAGVSAIKLDEGSAQVVAETLASVAWLDDVRALTTDRSIQVHARFRKPIAVIKSGFSNFYVDSEQVMLDYVPMPHLLIVEIKGLPPATEEPRYGKVWQRDDLAEALTLMDRIRRMDASVTPNKPLLREIASIDIANFRGRQDSREPHIILYTKNNTEIIWGAELGKWQQYLESTDEQKLAKLFGYYKAHGTLLGSDVKNINLRVPRDNIPLPIDKY